MPIPPPAAEESPEVIAAKAALARVAQAQWRRNSISQRVSAVRALWRALEGERDALAAVIQGETGKPLAEVWGMELDAAGLIVDHFTRNAHRLLQDSAVAKPWPLSNKRAYVRYHPRGVAGLITPWNLPFLIPFGDMVPALLAGNAALLKPSEWATRTALFLEDRVRRCGLFPEGLVQVARGGAEAGKAVARAADIVLLTGSARAGRSVAAIAAERLIPAVLELGGKHPMLVARNAPIERAAKAAAWSAFANCGQLCVGVERIFVEDEAYEAFGEALCREAAALRQAEGGGWETDIGRLIFPGQLEVVEAHLEDARALGARVVGGRVLDRERLLVAPAVVLDAKPAMRVMREETFGPVAAVMRVSRLEEAVRLANESSYGLAASVWTRDAARGEEIAARLEAGLVGVNDPGAHYALCALPFGGIKESGLGRRHGDEGLRMFCWPQSVLVHEWPAGAPDPWWFPYGRAKSRLLSLLARLS